MQVDQSAIVKFPYAVVRDYLVFPVSMERGQITLAVAEEMEESDKRALEFILCTPIQFETLQRHELDALRRQHYGIGVGWAKCPYCASSEIAEIIWNLAFDEDPRFGDPA